MTKHKIEFYTPKSVIDSGYICSVSVSKGAFESLPPKKECVATVIANSPDEAKKIIEKTFPGSYIKTCI